MLMRFVDVKSEPYYGWMN